MSARDDARETRVGLSYGPLPNGEISDRAGRRPGFVAGVLFYPPLLAAAVGSVAGVPWLGVVALPWTIWAGAHMWRTRRVQLYLVQRPTWMPSQTRQLIVGLTPERREAIATECRSLDAEIAVRSALQRIDEICVDVHAQPIQSRDDRRIDELNDLAKRVLDVERLNRATARLQAAEEAREEATRPTVTGEVIAALDAVIAEEKARDELA